MTMRIRQSVLADMGDLAAPKGSPRWCVAVREEARAAVRNLIKSLESTRCWVGALKENDNFRSLTDEHGQPFATWEAFCRERMPFGLGLSAEQVERLVSVPEMQQRG